MKQKIVAFDTFRFILALCVLFGHSFIMLFKIDATKIITHNLAVDGFFVLSGFLLAKSCYRIHGISDNADLFLQLTKKRICRLWPEYCFAIIIVLLLQIIIFSNCNFFPLLFNLSFISQINKVPGIVNGSWYISVLFWIGCVYSALLIYKGKTAVYIIIPLITFLSFGYIYPVYNHLTLHGTNHYILNAYPVAFLKGLMGMGLGISTYYVCYSLQDKPLPLKKVFKKNIVTYIEVLSLCLLIWVMSRPGTTYRDFLIYFAYIPLISILYFQKETFLKFLSWKIWSPLAPTAYMLYLTHCIWLEIIKRYIPYKEYPQSLVYLMVMAFFFFFAIICYHLQKWLFAKLKNILFVNTPQTTSQNISGEH